MQRRNAGKLTQNTQAFPPGEGGERERWKMRLDSGVSPNVRRDK